MLHNSVFCVKISVFPDSDNLLFVCRPLLLNVYMHEKRGYFGLVRLKETLVLMLNKYNLVPRTPKAISNLSRFI
jgi:hypothetical protein